MSADGTTDYMKFSDAELAKARVHVDFRLNPLDHENVRLELQRRRERRWRKHLPVMLRVVAYFFIAGGAMALGHALLGAAQLSLLSGNFRIALSAWVIMTGTGGIAILWAVAGIQLLRKQRSGLYLGIPAIAFQLVAFSLHGVNYLFAPLYAARLLWSWPNVGYSLSIGPKIWLRFGVEGADAVAVDIVSLYVLILLWRGIRLMDWPRSAAKALATPSDMLGA